MRNKLLTLAAVSCIGLAGCTNIGIPSDTGFLMQKELVAGKSYAITHLNGVLLEDSLNATMDFSTENMISGRGFCNLYRGTYEVSYNNLLEIDDTIFTSMECSENNATAVESELAAVFTEDISVSKSILGYKMTSSKGSFQIMELQVVVRP